MYTRLTSPSRMSAHTTHSRSRSPWLWAFLIMFMIWGVWVLLPQPDHLAASSDITEQQQQQHAKTFSSLANAQPATSPSDDLKSSNGAEDGDGTEDSVVADAIKSLLDDDEEGSEIKSSTTIGSEEMKEEDDHDDNDDDDEEEEQVAQPTETAKSSPALSSEPTSIIADEDLPEQTSLPSPQSDSDNGVGIVIHTHDDNNDSTVVLEEPTKTIDISQAQAQVTSAVSIEDGEKQALGGGEDDQEDDVEGEDDFVMSITAVSWPAATDL